MSLELKLERSLNEKDVENIYRSEFSRINGATITSPYKVDGLFELNNVRTLLEFKFDEDFKNKLSQCNVLIQCLYYIKKFEVNGEKLPSTIFIGDINECFVIHVNSIIKYLSHSIDWSIAPSEAHKKNPELIKMMVDDVNILPFVFSIDNNFDFKVVIEKIKDFSENVQRKVRITKHNIVTIFDYFTKHIITKSKLTTNEKANLFVQIIVNGDENFLHPKKKNILVTKSFGDVNVASNLFNSFFSHFEGDVYSPKEKEGLTALVDRLVEDSVRRNKGEFFTPTPFVDLAHKYISDTFGDDWKDKFVVWDCAWGTGNLTRDYKFKELYVSTLEQSDIDTANQMGYNMEAIKFQYDFLNDDDDKLPEGLRKAIDGGKEILFLINPPYQDGSELSTIEGESNFKGNIQTLINKEMLKNKCGKCSKQLFAQFLYRIIKYQEKNKNIKIAFICKPLYFSGESYKDFRNIFFNKFSYENGFLFEANHFSDVAKGWGISCSLFSEKSNNIKENFIHDVVDYDMDFNLVKLFDNNINIVRWIKEKQICVNEVIGLKSALNHIGETGKVPDGTLGTITWQSNNVNGNQQFVLIFSQYGRLKGKGSQFITKNNFLKSNLFFTARRLISGQHANWINDKDEYLAPNESHPDYEQFTYDSIVYSLFNNSSQQSSLRQVDYKDKKWDIKNEFFWLSKNEMLQLAEDDHYDELYQDARTSDERFVYNKLFTEGIYNRLSPDAKDVLDSATELLKKSIQMRKILSENHPEYHLNSWDAGYAQLKLVWKEYFKDEFNEFRKKYKELEDRMRPLVYELGFLLK